MGCDVRRFSVPSERSLFTVKTMTMLASGPKRPERWRWREMDFPPVVNSVKNKFAALRRGITDTAQRAVKALPCSSASEEPASKETGRFSDVPSVPCETAPAGRAWSCYLFPILALTALLMPSPESLSFICIAFILFTLPFQSIYCRFHPDHPPRWRACAYHSHW